MAAKLLPRVKRAVARFVMVPSSGGCFELTVNGRAIYSKLQTGRFPDENELVAEVAQIVGA